MGCTWCLKNNVKSFVIQNPEILLGIHISTFTFLDPLNYNLSSSWALHDWYEFRVWEAQSWRTLSPKTLIHFNNLDGLSVMYVVLKRETKRAKSILSGFTVLRKEREGSVANLIKKKSPDSCYLSDMTVNDIEGGAPEEMKWSRKASWRRKTMSWTWRIDTEFIKCEKRAFQQEQ